MLIWKLQTVRWGHGQEWDNFRILNYSHTILTALPSESLFGVRPKWLTWLGVWLGYEVWWCIIPKKLAKELHFPSGNGCTKDSDWLVSFSLTKLPIRSGLFRPKVPGVRGSNDRPWGRTCWHPRGKSNGTGGGGWDSNSSVDGQIWLRCWFLVQGCWGGKRLRVEACFDMLFRYSVIQYKSRTLFGQLYLTMVPNHRFGRRLTGMYGNHPKGETTWNLQLQWNIIEISSSAKWSEQEANSTSCRFVEGFFWFFEGGGAWVFSFRCHHLHIIYVVKIRLVYQARDELWHATLGRWDGDGLRSARLFLIGGFAFQPAESLATQAISHWGCFILDSF